MSKSPKVVLIQAAALLSLAGIDSAGKSPELTTALASFGADNISDYEADEVYGGNVTFDDGPATLLSQALGNSEYDDRVASIVAEHEAVITTNLAPAVEKIRQVLNIKD